MLKLRIRKPTLFRINFDPEYFAIGVIIQHTFAKTDEGPKKMFTMVRICILPCVHIRMDFIRDFEIRFCFQVSDMMGAMLQKILMIIQKATADLETMIHIITSPSLMMST